MMEMILLNLKERKKWQKQNIFEQQIREMLGKFA